MYPLTFYASQQIRRSHSRTVRATVFGPQGTPNQVSVAGGSVTVDSKSQVRRTAELSLTNPKLWPLSATDLLTPYGSEVYVEYGIVLPSRGIEWIPLIRGVVTDVGRTRPVTSSGAVTVSLADRSIKIAEDRFETPTQTLSGATVVSEITRLIKATLPAATVIDKTASTQVAPVMEMQRDRWADGIEKLADAIGAEVFCDPIGQFVIRPQPKLTDSPVWDIRSGAGGVLVSKTDRKGRDRVYNKVSATGERSDGTTPVTGSAADTDPKSPTYYGGSFGKKTYFYSSPLLTTSGQCVSAATSLLERAKGGGAQVSVQVIVNPGLDAGDVITVTDQRRVQTHIVDRLEIPLGVSATQSITTRTLDLEG